MALTTRKITNAGDPLVDPKGNPVMGATITFMLVNASGRATDVWDAISGERVTPTATAITASTDTPGGLQKGEFEIELWPNDRGEISTQYYCRMDIPGVRPFLATLPTGNDSTLSWIDFMASSLPITPADVLDIYGQVALAQNAAIATAADRVQTGLDVIDTAADAVATEADRVQTGLDRVATGLDAVNTADDVIATAADRVQTGLDAIATAADRVQTGLDRTAAAASAAGVQPQLDAFGVRVGAVEAGQSTALVGYSTQALLYADLAHPANTVGYVTADSTASKNGYYLKSGASGAGSWTQSSYDRVAALETLTNTIWEKHVNISIVPQAAAGVIAIGSVVTNTVVFSFPASFLLNGKDNYKTIPALSNLSLANTQCCYLDITDLAAITWSAATAITNIKDSKNKILAVINFYGKLFSPIASVQSMIYKAERTYDGTDAAFTSGVSSALKRANTTFCLGNGAAALAISSVSGSSVTFTIGSGFHVDGVNAYKAVPALTATTLANVGCLYLNIANLDAIVWETGGVGLVTATKLLAVMNFYGKLFSPIPSIHDMIKRAEDVYNGLSLTPLIKAANAIVAPISGGIITLTNINSPANSITVAMSAAFSINGIDSYKTVPALSATTLANTNSIYLDVTDINAIAWSTTGPASATKLVAMTNFYGRLFSSIPSIQSLINDAYTAYSSAAATVVYVDKTVAASGGDYTTITAAIAAITDASATKQYNVYISDGTYSETGPNNFGLELKPYIHLLGAGKNRVKIKGPEAAPGSQHTMSCIHLVASCRVEDVTLIAYKNKYCIHADSANYTNLDFIARNCRLQHYGGDYRYDVGIGMYQNQKLTFEDCEFLGDGIYMHGPAASRAVDTSYTLTVKNCVGKELYLQDFLDYNKHKIIIEGSRFDLLTIAAVRTYYDANPGDTLFNKGYFNQSHEYSFRGSRIGRVLYADSFTLDTVLVSPLVIPGVSERCINKGAGSIVIGQALKRLADTETPDAYPSSTLTTGNVAAWNGSGIFSGVALTAMSVDAEGSYQYTGNPYVYADASGAAIVYGDELEVNSSGSFVKRTTGTARANALESKSSGTGLIIARLLS